MTNATSGEATNVEREDEETAEDGEEQQQDQEAANLTNAMEEKSLI